jgi:IS5 family transposase
LHGQEKAVFADAGYTGADKRPELEDRDVDWNIAIKRGHQGLSGISCGGWA